MATRLVLIVHAETAATRKASFPIDESLTAKGREAADRLGRVLPAFARTWRSPAAAARDTAIAFAREAVVEPSLADLDCGRWRGYSLEAVLASNPKGAASWLADPLYSGHDGEAIATLFDRVAQWLDGRRDNRGTALAITHAAVVRCAILATLGATPDGFWRVDAAPLTRVELSSDGRRWTLRQILKADP